MMSCSKTTQMPRITSQPAESYLTMHVVNHVRSLIENYTLKPGDRVPPERDFARTLNISRASLRTGIGYLAALGVMKIKHGVGTFVADRSPEFGQRSLGLMGALHGFQPGQMFEARSLLEGNLAALAAKRANESHHACRAEAVIGMFGSVDNPSDYLIHAVLFHRTIAQALGNQILAALMEAVASSIYYERSTTVKQAINLRESAEMHRKIYRAIRVRKPAEARDLMEQHQKLAQAAQKLEQVTRRRHSRFADTSIATDEKLHATRTIAHGLVLSQMKQWLRRID